MEPIAIALIVVPLIVFLVGLYLGSCTTQRVRWPWSRHGASSDNLADATPLHEVHIAKDNGSASKVASKGTAGIKISARAHTSDSLEEAHGSPASKLGMRRTASVELGDIYRTASALSVYLDGLDSRPIINRLMSMPAMPNAAERLMELHQIDHSIEVTMDEIDLQEKIGTGGFGAVYKGTWRGAPVAVKYVVCNTADRDQLEQSIREVVLSKKMSHPNVVQTYAWTVLTGPEAAEKAEETDLDVVKRALSKTNVGNLSGAFCLPSDGTRRSSAEKRVTTAFIPRKRLSFGAVPTTPSTPSSPLGPSHKPAAGNGSEAAAGEARPYRRMSAPGDSSAGVKAIVSRFNTSTSPRSKAAQSAGVDISRVAAAAKSALDGSIGRRVPSCRSDCGSLAVDTPTPAEPVSSTAECPAPSARGSASSRPNSPTHRSPLKMSSVALFDVPLHKSPSDLHSFALRKTISDAQQALQEANGTSTSFSDVEGSMLYESPSCETLNGPMSGVSTFSLPPRALSIHPPLGRQPLPYVGSPLRQSSLDYGFMAATAELSNHNPVAAPTSPNFINRDLVSLTEAALAPAACCSAATADTVGGGGASSPRLSQDSCAAAAAVSTSAHVTFAEPQETGCQGSTHPASAVQPSGTSPRHNAEPASAEWSETPTQMQQQLTAGTAASQHLTGDSAADDSEEHDMRSSSSPAGSGRPSLDQDTSAEPRCCCQTHLPSCEASTSTSAPMRCPRCNCLFGHHGKARRRRTPAAADTHAAASGGRCSGDGVPLAMAHSEAAEDLSRMHSYTSFNSEEGFGSPSVARRNRSKANVFELEGHQLEGEEAMMVVVMEYCDLGSLLRAITKKAFKPHGKWSYHTTYRALLRTAQEIAKGLDYIHGFGIIHGDLKPGNVLLKTHRIDRRGYVAKVSDFGLSRPLMGSEREVSVGNNVGTIAYTAPETFANNYVKKPSDVYAFGVMMWEMFMCKSAYEGLMEGQICLGVSDGTLRPEFNDSCPLPYQTLARQCWHQDPDQRPTFKEIVAHLTEIEVEFRKECHRQLRPATTSPTRRPSALGLPLQWGSSPTYGSPSHTVPALSPIVSPGSAAPTPVRAGLTRFSAHAAGADDTERVVGGQVFEAPASLMGN